MKLIALIPAVAASAALAACGSAVSSAPAASPAARPTATAAAAPPSPAACKLKVTFNYFVRTTEPGLAASAQEIGNVDFSNCTPTLRDFAQTAGQAQGECTTIARARANPGYDVNATPAPPLRRVIMSAGPGC